MSALRIEWFVFYFGIPLIQAILNGSKGTTYAPSVSWHVLIPFWYVSGQVFWLLCSVATSTAERLFERVPLLLCALLGGFSSITLSFFYIGLFIGVSGEAVGELRELLVPGTFLLKDSMFSYVFGANAFGGVVTWIAAFALRSRIKHGVWDARWKPSSWHASATLGENSAGDSELPVPAFMEKLDIGVRGRILAVEAQEHYIKVHTVHGTGLVLYRFRDALVDLAELPGFRVHRSFWVAGESIQCVEGRGRTFQLTLENDLRIPVSQSYRGVLEVEGLI